MNFWEFKEDNSRGYYMPVSNKAAREQGGQLVTGLFNLIFSLFKLLWALITGVFALFYIFIRWIWRLASKQSRQPL